MPELPLPVRRALHAANAGDDGEFVASFVPGLGYVSDFGREYHGAAAIRQWSDSEFIGKKVAVDVLTSYVREDGDIVVIVEVGGEGYTGPSTFTFQVRDELLASMRIFA
jgi:hypothetical protein